MSILTRKRRKTSFNLQGNVCMFISFVLSYIPDTFIIWCTAENTHTPSKMCNMYPSFQSTKSVASPNMVRASMQDMSNCELIFFRLLLSTFQTKNSLNKSNVAIIMCRCFFPLIFHIAIIIGPSTVQPMILDQHMLPSTSDNLGTLQVQDREKCHSYTTSSIFRSPMQDISNCKFSFIWFFFFYNLLVKFQINNRRKKNITDTLLSKFLFIYSCSWIFFDYIKQNRLT